MFTALLSLDSLWLENIDWHPMGIMLEIFIFIYAFCALACVCDTYLILSLETLCVRWNVREDVAGATILALGSAAPELIIASVNTIGGESDLGVGAIIGSGMLAFSVLPGLMALVAGSDLLLKRRPLARDSITYLLAFIALTIFIADGFIELWESAILFSMYIIYVIVVVASPTVREKMIMRRRQAEYAIKVREAIAMGADRTTLEELKIKYLSVTERKSFVHQKKEEQQLALMKPSSKDSSDLSSSFLSQDEQKQASVNPVELEAPLGMDDDDEGPSVYEVEDTIRAEGPSMSKKAKAWRFFTWPLQRTFDLTCINCEHDGPNAKYYPLTFLVAFLWVAVFSFLISVVSSRFNEISGLPLSLFGIILVAVGAEVPDGVQSLSVAKRGYGSMAVSNSCGAQITNVLVGLGLPWFVANIVGVGEGTRAGFDCKGHSESCIPNPELKDGMVPWRGIQIREHEDLTIAAAFQFVNLGLFVTLLLLSAIFKKQSKAVLSKAKGKVMMGFYLVVILGYCITSQVLVAPTADPQYYAPLD